MFSSDQKDIELFQLDKFRYVYLESGVCTSRKTYRDFTVLKSSSSQSIGEDHLDLSLVFKDCAFDQSTGKLIFNFKEIHQFSYFNKEVGEATLNDDIYSIVSVILNELAVTIFEFSENKQSKLVGLLNGAEPISCCSTFSWDKLYYNENKARKIDFKFVNDFAFDSQSALFDMQDNRFSIQLKKKYQNNPYIIYAIQDVLNEAFV